MINDCLIPSPLAAFRAEISYTGFSSEIGTELRESAVGQAGGSCYSRAVLSSNDSKTLYKAELNGFSQEKNHSIAQTRAQ